MKYKSGFFRSVLGVSWAIETQADQILYRSENKSGSIKYYDIQKVVLRRGVVSDTVNINVKNDYVSFTNMSAIDAAKLNSDIEDRTRKTVIAALSLHFDILKTVPGQISLFLGENRYIAQSNVSEWLKNFPEFGAHLLHPYFDIGHLPKEVSSSINMLKDIQSSGSTTLQLRNLNFVQTEMDRHKNLFDQLEKYPLTNEQKKAAIIDEDRNLLIAAAGSGKSSTIVAKVAYVVETGLASPNEILVLAYNKDAQVEIEQRLALAMSKLKNPQSSIKPFIAMD